MTPPMMPIHRHPPVVTNASANIVNPPMKKANAMRITVTEIDDGRVERITKPSSSQMIPATRNIHQLCA